MGGIHNCSGSWYILSSRVLRVTPINTATTRYKYNNFIAILTEWAIKAQVLLT